MVERSAVDTFVHDLENTLYDLVAKGIEVVESVVDVVESAAKNFEAETTPVYVVDLDGEVDVQEWVRDYRERNGLPLYDNMEDAEESGGRETTGQSLSREELLRELYRYAAKHSGEYGGWGKDFEDYNADEATSAEIKQLLYAVERHL